MFVCGRDVVGGHMSPDEFYAKQNVNTRAASVTAGGAPSYKSPWF